MEKETERESKEMAKKVWIKKKLTYIFKVRNNLKRVQLWIGPEGKENYNSMGRPEALDRYVYFSISDYCCDICMYACECCVSV